ncbi:MerC mercury resistance protein [Pseudidiomarina planktonica]|uniref:MerC mercury resistance protein n=1 Tax=Pseudidiomarina planktonica TaxID=1323738 RepID=A0A1Y6G3L0_9GAMM|nr:MerC domain-containing protein [Pseudidiomarina planktonica]RUO63801.1 MerC domain-containing protein [Pseudidiomarina planktonica]SMQ80135.1 MerC mercury resistance protein [Pseudidiomarina planktonica]
MSSVKSLDKTGMWVTAVCAIHCLLLPVILPMLSLIGLSFIGAETLEKTILGTSILVGAIALSLGTRQHARWYPIALLLVGGLIYSQKDTMGELGEPIIILAGASLIIIAHWVNLRLLRARVS